MKKFIIQKSGGGELANQLWNYVSIYAYGLETGAAVRNPAFFEYHSFFNFLPQGSWATRFVSLFFQRVRRRAHPINRFWRTFYAGWNKLVLGLHASCTLSSQNTANATTYLPPTQPLQSPPCSTLYFAGWLFRNPDGLKKYRTQLLDAFSPRADIKQKVDETIAALRTNKKHLIGVHIRQGDYKTFKGGRYLVPTARMREIIDEYITERGISPADTAVLIASDEAVDLTLFKGLEVLRSAEDAVTDLFLLSRCDTVIGSDSSFGNFAAWYGNIPHIVATKEPVDWSYYADKKEYFQNKYATLVQF